MNYLFIATVACWVLAYSAYKYADAPSDDFSRGFAAIIAFALAVVMTVIYGGLAFWNHRFW